MEEQGLLEVIVARTGSEMEALLAQVDLGKLNAGELEHQVQGILRETSRDLTGVLLKAADRQLCSGKPLHDRRTRTMVTLFGRTGVALGSRHM
jgi:hypothetical protein